MRIQHVNHVVKESSNAHATDLHVTTVYERVSYSVWHNKDRLIRSKGTECTYNSLRQRPGLKGGVVEALTRRVGKVVRPRLLKHTLLTIN